MPQDKSYHTSRRTERYNGERYGAERRPMNRRPDGGRRFYKPKPLGNGGDGQSQQQVDAAVKRSNAGEKPLDVAALKKMKVSELHEMARKLKVENITGVKKQDLIFKILQSQAVQSGLMFGEGYWKF